MLVFKQLFTFLKVCCFIALVPWVVQHHKGFVLLVVAPSKEPKALGHFYNGRYQCKYCFSLAEDFLSFFCGMNIIEV
jgi:hypothetical protein